jgi:hypothetical protein
VKWKEKQKEIKEAKAGKCGREREKWFMSEVDTQHREA